MSLPPFDLNHLPSEGGNSQAPDLTYDFRGYYYFGFDNEVGVGLYLKDVDVHDESLINIQGAATITATIIDEINSDMFGLYRMTTEDQVSDDQRREATGYLTLGEVYERGNRIEGVEWGIYEKYGQFYLWVGDSG